MPHQRLNAEQDFQPSSYANMPGGLNEVHGSGNYAGDSQFDLDHLGGGDPFGTHGTSNFNDLDFGHQDDFLAGNHGLGDHDGMGVYNQPLEGEGFHPSSYQGHEFDQPGGGSFHEPNAFGQLGEGSFHGQDEYGADPLGALHDHHSPLASFGAGLQDQTAYGLGDHHSPIDVRGLGHEDYGFGNQQYPSDGGLGGDYSAYGLGGHHSPLLDDQLLHRGGSPHNVRFNETPDYRSASYADPLADSFSNLDLGRQGEFGSYMDRQADLSHAYDRQMDPYLGAQVDPGLSGLRGHSASPIQLGTSYGESQTMNLADQLLRQGSPRSEAAFSHDSSMYGQDAIFSDPILNYNREDGALQDLIFYQNQLESNQQLDEATRQQMWTQRMAFETLDDAARSAQWETMSENGRSRLGLDGYWGSRIGEPGYYERKIQSGWDREGYLSAAMPISSPVLNRLVVTASLN
jgi:hypothetical protein